MKIAMHCLAAVALAFASPLVAQTGSDPARPTLQEGQGTAEGAATDLTEGEVRKVDKANARLTLRHAEIKNLDMPRMTMVFEVKDPALIGTLQAGDKVRFKALREGGKFIVTEIVPVR